MLGDDLMLQCGVTMSCSGMVPPPAIPSGSTEVRVALADRLLALPEILRHVAPAVDYSPGWSVRLVARARPEAPQEGWQRLAGFIGAGPPWALPVRVTAAPVPQRRPGLTHPSDSAVVTVPEVAS